jgi:hypothetical protein
METLRLRQIQLSPIPTLTVTNSAGTSTTQIFTGRTVSNNGGPNAITSQQVDMPPLPPTNFIGAIKKIKCPTRYCLTATWNASPTSDVVLYRIYRNNKVVGTVSASQPLTFKKCFRSRYIIQELTIVAVSSDGLESSSVPLQILP